MAETTLLPVLDFGDIAYMHVAQPVLKPSAIRFITEDNFRTRHCSLYKKNWD